MAEGVRRSNPCPIPTLVVPGEGGSRQSWWTDLRVGFRCLHTWVTACVLPLHPPLCGYGPHGGCRFGTVTCLLPHYLKAGHWLRWASWQHLLIRIVVVVTVFMACITVLLL